MNRVIVVGTTGCGKTTLACELAGRMKCPFIKIDALFWGPNWTQASDNVFLARVAEAIQPERWAAGGNYSRVRDLVWRRADTLIWLDYPLPLVMWRLFRRTIHRLVTQEELWAGNRERWRTHFLSHDSLFVWAVQSHRRQQRSYPLELAKPEYAHLCIFRFHSPRETETWLNSIESEVLREP